MVCPRPSWVHLVSCIVTSHVRGRLATGECAFEVQDGPLRPVDLALAVLLENKMPRLMVESLLAHTRWLALLVSVGPAVSAVDPSLGLLSAEAVVTAHW